MSLGVDEAVQLLGHRLSPQRRRGAKRLRALAERGTAPAVRAALRRELEDERTWETRYQMIMALGASGDDSDVHLLQDVVATPRRATMVHCAAGDALVRLDRRTEHDSGPLLWCVALPERDLLDVGALRATAHLRLVPDGQGIPAALAATDRLLRDPERPNDTIGVWGLVAAAGWPGQEVHDHLESFTDDHRPEVTQIARASLQGRYTDLKGM